MSLKRSGVVRNKEVNAKICRVLDANLNRAKEGLRVCEDVCRFVYDDASLTRRLKAIRHSLTDIGISMRPALIKVRDIDADVGKPSIRRELKRKDIKDIVYANMQRIKESIRVLEEFTKLGQPKKSGILKSLRYKIYALEQDIIKKV